MESRIKLLGHPVHQLLVPFPIGGFALSVAMDTWFAISGKRQHRNTARHALDFGLITAIAAAPFGAVDLLAVPPGTRAKRIGMSHALGNIVMLGLFATSRFMRRRGEASLAARSISASAFALSGLTAWLGGELVVRHGIGVSDRAVEEQSKQLNDGSNGAPRTTRSAAPPKPRRSISHG